MPEERSPDCVFFEADDPCPTLVGVGTLMTLLARNEGVSSSDQDFAGLYGLVDASLVPVSHALPRSQR